MHELPVTEKILAIALKHAEQNGATRIHTITLRVGGLTDLKEEWLQRYFSYLSRETIATEARLIIKREAVTLLCGRCRTMIETEKSDLTEITCPHCGVAEGFSILSGREYSIEEMTAE